jgi:hypothetical protein
VIAADCVVAGAFSAAEDASRFSANLEALAISNSSKQLRQTQNLINIKTTPPGRQAKRRIDVSAQSFEKPRLLFLFVDKLMAMG